MAAPSLELEDKNQNNAEQPARPLLSCQFNNGDNSHRAVWGAPWRGIRSVCPKSTARRVPRCQNKKNAQGLYFEPAKTLQTTRHQNLKGGPLVASHLHFNLAVCLSFHGAATAATSDILRLLLQTRGTCCIIHEQCTTRLDRYTSITLITSIDLTTGCCAILELLSICSRAVVVFCGLLANNNTYWTGA